MKSYVTAGRIEKDVGGVEGNLVGTEEPPDLLVIWALGNRLARLVLILMLLNTSYSKVTDDSM